MATQWFGAVARRVMMTERLISKPPLPLPSPQQVLSESPILCGRGDKKTKKGKRFKGSFGNSRPKREKRIERFKDKGLIVRIGANNVKTSAIQAFQKVFPLGNKKNTMRQEEQDNERSNFVPTLEDKEFPPDNSDELATIPNISLEELGDEESMPEKIRYASIKLICVGVAIGLLTFAGLKYLPTKNGLTVARKEAESPFTSNFVNVVSNNINGDIAAACLTDEEIVGEQPKMDARFAESLVHKWQGIKSLVLGPEHVSQNCQRYGRTELQRLHNMDGTGNTQIGLTIDSVTVSMNGRRAMVEATLEEEAHLID
ncbi:hypothetical protein GIB67_004744 [Kingdonia uniflora]|uniref:Plastid division protein CDP1-like IMS domain-containing protein n=1 Tax=Kingdonia uniflora TaxID=39325 RepID=A0A7J7NQV0_9MAGN|nr:hypothetical protein GIB67_004744 [Kingdonia uniflora]